MSVKRPRCESGVEEGGPNLTLPAWQEDTETVKERDMYLLENNIYTDVTFIVGHEKQSISCHRLFLARSSAVFDSMLFGELHKNVTELYIPDVTPQAFRTLLAYIYSGDLKFESYQAGWDVLHAAKKYLMPRMCLAQIRQYLRKCIDQYCVWTAIDLAAKHDEQVLLDLAWQHVKKYAHDIVAQDKFLTIPPFMIETLVKQDDLNCSEIELSNSCIKWAKHEASRQNLTLDPVNIRMILAPIMPHIRVRNLGNLDSIREVLSEFETASILSRQVPPYLCANECKRQATKTEYFVAFAEPKIECPTCIKEGVIPDFTYTREASGIFPNERKVVYGLEIPTQINENPVNSTYEEKFTVFFIQHTAPDYSNWYRDTDLDPKDKIIEVYNFKSFVNYNSKIKIHFLNPSSLDVSGLFYFEIIFHKSGRYPNRGDKFLLPVCDEPPEEEDDDEEDSDSD